MIKINLLPKEIEQEAAVRQKFFLIGCAVGLILVFFAGVYFIRVAKLSSLKSKIKNVEIELGKLKPVVQKVNNIRARKSTLDNKLKVISDLMKSRLLYPVFLEEFAAVLPAKVWVTTLNTKTSNDTLNLNFNVLAKDNFAVADCIKALEQSEKFHNIKFTGITTVDSDSEQVRSFSITCDYYPTGQAPPKPKPNKKPVKKRRR